MCFIQILGVTMEVIASILNNFGVKKMEGLELFCRHLNLLSEAAKPLAKAQTTELFKEMFRWMRDHLWDRFKIHHEVKDEVVKFSKEYIMVPMEIKRGLPKASKRYLRHHSAKTQDLSFTCRARRASVWRRWMC